MKKLIAAYCLIITALFAITGVIAADGFNQIIFATMFVPIAFYFARVLFQKSPPAPILATTSYPSTNDSPNHALIPTKTTRRSLSRTSTKSDDSVIEGEELTDFQVRDINKRLFLKLIGGVGLSTFVFALFSKSTQAAFFGSVPGPGTVAIKDSDGNQIDPAEKQPTDGYEIADVDDLAAPAYYGFTEKDGNWYITREDATGGFRYAAGSTSYSVAWSNRAALSYDYFEAAF